MFMYVHMCLQVHMYVGGAFHLFLGGKGRVGVVWEWGVFQDRVSALAALELNL